MTGEGLFDSGSQGQAAADQAAAETDVNKAFVQGIQQAFSPVEDHLVQLAQQQQQIAHELSSLKNDMRQSTPDTKVDQAGLTEAQRKQWEDPEKFFTEKFDQKYAEKAGNDPRVQNMLMHQAANIWENLRTDFDQTYGEGKWDELIKPNLAGIESRFNVEQLADPAQSRAIFSVAKGSLDERVLANLRTEREQAQTKAREAAYAAVPGLVNGVRLKLPNNRISPEAKQLLDRVEDVAGVKFDEAAYDNFEEGVDFVTWQKQQKASRK